MSIGNFRRLTASALFLSSSLIALSASATIVEFETSQGNFKVNLYDETTPKTVENFLSYVNAGAYTNHVMHRSIANFIIQGGGFQFEGDFPLTPIDSNPAVVNEPIYSNVRNTIAMAKLGGNPNSATNQWFFNIADNSANLDLQNGGFTVFGEVIEDGMTVLDKIAAIETCSDIPMPGTADIGCSNIGTPGVENFVTVSQITIVDSSVSTASELSPAPTIDTDHDGVPNASDAYPTDPTRWQKESTNDDSGGGGPIAWLSGLLLGALLLRRR